MNEGADYIGVGPMLTSATPVEPFRTAATPTMAAEIAVPQVEEVVGWQGTAVAWALIVLGETTF